MALRPTDGSEKRVIRGDELQRRRIDADAEHSAAGARIRLAPGVLGRPDADDEEAQAKLAEQQAKDEEADRRYVPNRAEMRRHRKGARRAR